MVVYEALAAKQQQWHRVPACDETASGQDACATETVPCAYLCNQLLEGQGSKDDARPLALRGPYAVLPRPRAIRETRDLRLRGSRSFAPTVRRRTSARLRPRIAGY